MSMTDRNLLTMDDLLLQAGLWLTVAWALGLSLSLAGALDPLFTPAEQRFALILSASAPLGIGLTGFKLRRRENRALALWQIVDDHVEVPAGELLRDSDFTASTLEQAIRDLNNSGAAFLVWDRKADVIQDGRLRSAFIQVEECGGCRVKLSLRLRVGDVDGATCPYCGAALSMERVIEEKARLMDELSADRSQAPSIPSDPGSFSLGIFLVLTFLFWPAGAAYAIWHWRARGTRTGASSTQPPSNRLAR